MNNIEQSMESSEVGARIEATLAAKVNLADYQNAIPVLRELGIASDASRVMQGLELTLNSTPPFLRPKTWQIDAISPGQQLRITDLDVELDAALLTRLTESELAVVDLALRRRGENHEKLAHVQLRVELLPRNQWGGLSHLPDLIAAFVQPNEPGVERLLKDAAEILRKHAKNSAINGYEGGPKRAWELASAIWTAISAKGLDYALPPASFEHAGQKIRGPAQIMESGLATCLDLALLFCAAAEQAGLNPLLVFTKGHAFAGVWLKPEEFSTTVVDDITALRKRVKLNELVLFETTGVTQRPAVAFSRATLLGAQQISEEQDSAFELAVDIRRARMQRIKPLASAEAQLSPPVTQEIGNVVEPTFEDAPDLPDDALITESDPALLNPKDRLARWQRKLLDLSLRNNLLNFRATKKSLKLDAPDPSALEDMLSEGQTLKLLPRPDLMDGADPRSQAIYEGREREDVRRLHALDALKRRELFVGIPKDELDARLVDLYRSARNALQEGGANTLFLALGFLSWTRDDKEGQRYRAPLILVPVALNRKSARSGFTLSLHDDESRFNPTLVEMLRQDFKLNLGIAEGELPKDDAGLDVAAIWKSVAHGVKDIKGWEVTEDVVLGTFSFAKYLMWKDLVERTDQLRENPVVRHLIDTPRERYSSGLSFPNPRKLDTDFAPEKTFCPLPADSSQLSAVMAAVRGKDFVLVGPPGTGKSQTIANLISQCLAEEKRVLFVSEKIAALDVVYRRLREVGLGEFCLELHSTKARKLDVLSQLQKSWEAQGTIDPDVWRAEAQRLKRLRDDLNVYVERLHHRHQNGMTIFEAIGRVVHGRNAPVLPLSWSTANTHDASDMERMRQAVDRLAVNAQALGQGALVANPLFAVGQSDWSPTWQRSFVDATRAVLPAGRAVEEVYGHLTQASGLPARPLNRKVRAAMAVLVRTVPQAAGRDWRFVLRSDIRTIVARLADGATLLAHRHSLNQQLSPPWSDTVTSGCLRGLQLLNSRREILERLAQPWSDGVVEELKRGLSLLDDIDQQRGNLSVQYSEQIEQLNVARLQREWAKAEKRIWPLSWLGKRTIRKALDAAVMGEGEPDVGRDLDALVRIRAIRSEVSAIEIGPAVEGVWSGIRTRRDFVLCALSFQHALAAAKQRQEWEDSGFEHIASGRCGERLARELMQIRALKDVDAEIYSFAHIQSDTAGLWSGHSTDVDALNAALQFKSAVRDVRESGVLPGVHEAVARGECGPTLTADFQTLRNRADVEQKLEAFGDLSDITAGVWNGLSTQAAELEVAIKFQGSISAAIGNLAVTSEDLGGIKRALDHLLGEGNALLEPGGSVAKLGESYLSAWGSLQPTIDRLAVAGHFSEASKTSISDLSISDLIDRCNTAIAAEARLRGWCAWRKARDEAQSLQLGALVAAIECGSVSHGDVHTAFETNYSRWWLDSIVDEESVIRSFVSAEHEKRISDFRALDDKFTELTRAWVRAALCAELPTQDSVARNSEWGVLKHEMNKKKRHMPLRELMTRIPTALTKLTPCLLMSPLSIAQYLAADATTFDVVVFDEASQIPVWDAIGAMARGKQVVMVGDPKQLPPTNFFDRAESDLDDEDVEGDLESILDECLGANLPTMNLSWHYRSRSESLIAFSNHRYYRGELVTFPSPVTDDRAVSFHFVKGTYAKGGARINQAEAKALVADLVARLNEPGFRESKLTIGVVTFNAEQQALIEDLLDDERRKNPTIEPYFAEVELEPIFVKNLESVQGDERDIMYFSITYGPDVGGAVSMNFGPMNREGGERRLNVAITRARHELRVFSSLKAEQMDLARTQAIGVRDLKHFLEFAERGPRALAEATVGIRGGFESPFEEFVASALASKGWELHSQVGVSAFRIDLAVVHPDAKGTYLAGVECDGATYHRSATAKDRDKLREQVLRGLGWNILRVWSTDWWIDPEGTLERLDAGLRTLLESSRAHRAEMSAKEAARLATAEAIARAQENARLQSRDASSSLDASANDPNKFTTVPGPANVVREQVHEVYARNVSDAGALVHARFVEATSVSAIDGIDPEAFFEPSYDSVLARMISHVVEIEGPTLDAVLARRIARAHGWQRTGGKIQQRVEALASKSHKSTEESVGTFYWAHGRGPNVAVSFRRADDAARTVDEICMDELTALAGEVASSGLHGEDAIVAMARELGLQRLRSASRERLEKAMARAGAGKAGPEFSDTAFFDFANTHAITHKDHRQRGGALWVEDSSVQPAVLAQLQSWGFKHKEGKGWWRA